MQALNLLALCNPGIRHVMIDGALFQQEVSDRKVMSVPSVFLNGEPFGQGRMTFAEILKKLDKGAEQREARKLSEKAPYDVLIVGGGQLAVPQPSMRLVRGFEPVSWPSGLAVK